jgi:hypothetical protein
MNTGKVGKKWIFFLDIWGNLDKMEMSGRINGNKYFFSGFRH